MNRDRLLSEGKTLALALACDYHPPPAPVFQGLGNRGRDAMQAMLDTLNTKGITTPHDLVVGHHLSNVLCGGDVAESATLSEDEVCALERQAFIALAQTAGTIDRIEYMLKNGKPLRN